MESNRTSDEKFPRVVSASADDEFRRLCRELGRDPDDPWLGQYVEYEWGSMRFAVEGLLERKANPDVFEFGCNVGATATVLALMGATVTAVDIDPKAVDIARANARRYGVEDRISFLVIEDSARLPFSDESFDLIVCNSVLEYVDADLLHEVELDLKRILRIDGFLLVTSTSNRLWPREVHSRRWFSNYLPRAFDRWLGSRERGIFPWQITGGFHGLRNADREDGCQQYLRAKEKMGTAPWKLLVLRIFSFLVSVLGVTPGLLTPSIAVTLRKSER